MMTRAAPASDAQAGDFGTRLEALFQATHGELLGTLYYIVGNLEDARDAVQETFLKCWRNQPATEEVVDLKAWVFRVALNTGRDLRKTAWNRRKQPLAEDAAMLATAPGPEVAVLQEEQLDSLRRALLRLRPEEQEVFLLRQNGGLTYEQIAAATFLPLGTVKTRMRAAIQQLRTAVGHD
jgi:RNA polymerase sigma factor (sigma-70 family)